MQQQQQQQQLQQQLQLREVLVCTAERDTTSHVIDIHSYATLHTFKPNSAPLAGTTYLGAGRWASIQLDRGLVSFFDYSRDQPLLKCPIPEKLSCLAASPVSGAYCVAGSESGKLYVWCSASGALLAVVQCHYKRVSALAISTDNALIATASDDSSVNIYSLSNLVADTDTPQPLWTVSSHSLPVTALHFSTGSCALARLYTSSLDSTVRVHDVLAKTTLATYTFAAAINDVAVTESEAALFAAGADGVVYQVDLTSAGSAGSAERTSTEAGVIQDAADGSSTLTFLGSGKSAITQIALAPVSGLLVTGTQSGTVTVYDIASRTLLHSLPLYKSPVSHLSCIVKEDCAPHLNISPLARFKTDMPDDLVVVASNRSNRPTTGTAVAVDDDWRSASALKPLLAKLTSEAQHDSTVESLRTEVDTLQQQVASYQHFNQQSQLLIHELWTLMADKKTDP
ncbi:Pre-rRNA-processing protein ipi3 [Sorochytrium milnesiophthora]